LPRNEGELPAAAGRGSWRRLLHVDHLEVAFLDLEGFVAVAIPQFRRLLLALPSEHALTKVSCVRVSIARTRYRRENEAMSAAV
jgi:hypothetical protein